MKIHARDFRVDEGDKVDLDKVKTETKPYYRSKTHYQEVLEKQTEDLSHLQNLQYAHDRYALLIIFQAMDAAGKDGAIKHVMAGVNPTRPCLATEPCTRFAAPESDCVPPSVTIAPPPFSSIEGMHA